MNGRWGATASEALIWHPKVGTGEENILHIPQDKPSRHIQHKAPLPTLCSACCLPLPSATPKGHGGDKRSPGAAGDRQQEHFAWIHPLPSPSPGGQFPVSVTLPSSMDPPLRGLLRGLRGAKGPSQGSRQREERTGKGTACKAKAPPAPKHPHLTLPLPAKPQSRDSPALSIKE